MISAGSLIVQKSGPRTHESLSGPMKNPGRQRVISPEWRQVSTSYLFIHGLQNGL